MPGYLSFIDSSAFQGARKGWVFKRGDRGVGYYVDWDNPSMPTYYDAEYHERRLRVKEEREGRVDRKGRLELGVRKELYGRR